MKTYNKNTILQRGQPSLESKVGEEVVRFDFKIPISQLSFIKKISIDKKISAAEYIRLLIANDMNKEFKTDG